MAANNRKGAVLLERIIRKLRRSTVVSTKSTPMRTLYAHLSDVSPLLRSEGAEHNGQTDQELATELDSLEFMSYAVLQKNNGSGYIVVELASGHDPEELANEHNALYVISFSTKEAAEVKRDQLRKNSDPKWTS